MVVEKKKHWTMRHDSDNAKKNKTIRMRDGNWSIVLTDQTTDKHLISEYYELKNKKYQAKRSTSTATSTPETPATIARAEHKISMNVKNWRCGSSSDDTQ